MWSEGATIHIDKLYRTIHPPHHRNSKLELPPNSALLNMTIFSKAIAFKPPANRAAAIKAARVIRSIKSRYRAQAFLFLAYHFFLSSPMHLDIFIMFFILVSNFMNREQAFPSQLVIDGIRFLIDERRFIMP
jgi:hypothetical protein